MSSRLIECGIDIARPAAEVFDYACDVRRELEWNPRMLRAEILTEPPVGVGSRFHAVFGAGVGDTIIETTGYSPPRWWTARSTSRWLDTRFTGEVTDTSQGCRLVVRTELAPHGPVRLLAPFLHRIMRSSWDHNLTAIKALLEDSPGGCPAPTAIAQGTQPRGVVGAGGSHHLLVHPRLVVRFGALLAVGAVTFLICWTLAYLLLPEGLLRGRNATGVLAGGDKAVGTFMAEWLRIFIVNATIAAVLYVLPNLLRTPRGIPLGYLATLAMIVQAGVITGTNSFSIRTSTGKLAPTLEVFTHSGPYELAAFVLATTASYGIGRWQLVGRWPHQTAPRIAPQTLRRMPLFLGLTTAILAIAATAAWEAHAIIAAIH